MSIISFLLQKIIDTLELCLWLVDDYGLISSLSLVYISSCYLVPHPVKRSASIFIENGIERSIISDCPFAFSPFGGQYAKSSAL